MKVKPKKSKMLRFSGNEYTIWLSIDPRQRWETGRIGAKVDLKRDGMTLSLPFKEYQSNFEKVGGVEE